MSESTLLIVDDDSTNTRLLRLQLHQHNYLTIPLSNGIELLRYLNNNPIPDLILLDVMMPEMSGFEACSELRKKYTPNELPIIFLTAKTQINSLIEGFEVGGNDYLTKPCLKEELLSRVRVQLQLSEETKKRLTAEKELSGLNENLEKIVAIRTRELQESIENLKSTQEDLIESEKMAALGGLVAGIAHEINTPIGIGVTASSFLLEQTMKIKKIVDFKKDTSDDLNQFLVKTEEISNIILNNLTRAAKLVESFKQVAVDQISEQRRVFQLQEFVEITIQNLSPSYEKKSINLETKFSGEITMDSYPGIFSRIILNLIMNSLIHAYSEQSRGNISLEFKTHEKNQELEFIYSDDGKGMTADVVDQIFNPFFTTRRNSGGTGLGMHLVYNLITQQLRGKVRCESEINKGSTFTINIPLVTPNSDKTSKDINI